MSNRLRPARGVTLLWICVATLHAPALSLPAQERAAEPIRAVPFTDVRITGGFWAPRLATNREVTVPYTLDQCERTGRLANFAIAGGLAEGDFEGIYFNDSDVFKVVEGASYALATQPDPELEARLDALIASIVAAQEEDGYLYTIRSIRGADTQQGATGPERWSNLGASHELYNVGHMYEAAVAHYQATGKRTLLDVALKSADLIDRVFGPREGQRRDVPGHQEIEIGLAKLFHATGERRYLELAHFFLDGRGQGGDRELYGPYCQDHLPVSEQTQAVGHAVRAGYLYSGMTDVAAATGDTSYLAALDALWEDVVARKMYLTGGVGAARHGEAFGDAYQLPNAEAYAETCAAVAQILWNQRLFLLHGDARYVDVLERVLYNGFLSGVALEGDRFFYPNPLAANGLVSFNQGSAERAPWFGCSCCPVNVVRIVPSIPGLVFARREDAVFVNLYTASEATLTLDGGAAVHLRQMTDYPWSGRVRLDIEPETPADFELRLRVPGWARGEPLPSDLYHYARAGAAAVRLRVNGEEQPVALEHGYARIARRWTAGDRVELDLPMPVRRVLANERVAANRGRVALERGPIVYCFEGRDTGGSVADLVLANDARVTARLAPELLGGTMVLDVDAERVALDGQERTLRRARARAIPYHLWAHRGPASMAVWVARDPEVAQPRPEAPFAAIATVSASHTWGADSPQALNDGLVPARSGDHAIPRHTFWDHRGGSEWLQYDFAEPVTVSGVELYWFDDTGVGSCRVPASWRLLHATDEGWLPVPGAAGFGVEADRFNVVSFPATSVRALRVELELREGFSAGVLEWRVESADEHGDPQPQDGPLATRWAKLVDPERPLPEYPRPHLERETWKNLNGSWEYALRPRQEGRPQAWEGRILVPFPIESSLSGVARRLEPEQRLWYRRTFTLPAAWSGQHLLLHFGAVDWRAEVWIDGRRVGEHTGGYDPFSFDVTSALGAEEQHELVVAVFDPTDAGDQPRGKQLRDPRGIWYTPTSGIWQTVWLEPVPATHVRELRVVPDLAGARAHVSVDAPGLRAPLSPLSLEAVASLDGQRVAWGSGIGGNELTLYIPDPRAWSPDDPALYDLTVRIRDGERVIDEVRSYFGLRDVALGRDEAGVLRLSLNGEPLFQYGLLDQGFWPDGLYTAPSDEALRHDVQVTKDLGFNLARKHVKVEPERWYTWCDRLGLLVWQDIPSGGPYIGPDDPDAIRDAGAARRFEREAQAIVDARAHHPAIVQWVLFNEGWGQFETERLTAWLEGHDPTRIVNATSGWTDRGVGHVRDVHRYPGPAMPTLERGRAAVLGEFGGLGLPLAGHLWQADRNWGYRNIDSRAALTEEYLQLVRRLRPLIARGLSAAVYTQTSDVEGEVNGLMTYDREVIKVDVARVAAANRRLYLPPPVVRTCLATAREAAANWRYTFEAPPQGWERAEFDDSSWTAGPGGFGTADTPGARVGTDWSGDEIWIRRSFELPREAIFYEDGPLSGDLHLDVHHDEDAEIWLNGTLVAQLAGYSSDYALVPLSTEQRALLRRGMNTLAVHCRQTGGGQFIDVGLAWVEEIVR